jgi:Ca-activated chloride channel family protein
MWRQTPRLHAWGEICDSHLLEHLLQRKGEGTRMLALSSLFLSVLFMILSIAGPTWYKLPAPVYKAIHPRVLLLDMSANMMNTDLTPNRLSRAKFKLHDLFMRKEVGQFGLIVYTGEPFVVSPLTDDAQTISSLLSSLTPDIMPVGGQKLNAALDEARKLIQQAGYQHGQVLVLTADTPSAEAIDSAKKLAQEGIITSIMPVKIDKNLNPLFQRFANSGGGQLLLYSADSNDLDQWMNAGIKNADFTLSTDDDIPQWRDEGRWILILALLFLLPVFQRGWLQRVVV